MRMSRALVVLMVAVVLAGCDNRRSSLPLPSVPSPVAPSPAAPVLPQSLDGYVSDTAFRRVAGVRVEVLDGPQAGTQMTSDADGRFSYTGTFASPVTMRATKDGYAVATSAARPSTGEYPPYVSFSLAPLAPPVPVAGNYTLTITADSACAGIPNDVRTRTYAATVTPGSNTNFPANTFFNGAVSGGQFAPHANVFWIGVAGDYLAISLEGEGPSVVEQVGQNRYVAYYGSAGVSVGASGVSTISAPFKGLIEYCELKSAIGAYYDCSPALASVREECTSTNSRLILTRR